MSRSDPTKTTHHASFNQQIPSLAELASPHSTQYSNDYPPPDVFPKLPTTLKLPRDPGNIHLEGGERAHYFPQARKHQRSLTELLPQFPTFYSGNSISPTRSPIKEISRKEFEDEFMPTLTGDKAGLIKVSDKSRGLSSWFSGSSAPVSLGIPSTMEISSPSTGRLQKRPTIQNTEKSPIGKENVSPSTPASTTSIFGGLFAQKPKTASPRASQNGALADELLTIHISKALFPAGPNEYDPFSPSAFKNLLMNAEGLLAKMQTALKLRTQALQELAAEKSAKDEEYEEAEIRARSLKEQLQQMAAQLAEKERINSELVHALATERNARAEEACAREKSIALVKEQAAQHRLSVQSDNEDLGISHAGKSSTTPARGSRSSYGSTDISEDEDAVFSARSMSPSTFVTSSSASVFSVSEQSMTSTTEIREASVARVVQVSNPSERPGPPAKRKSTFEKVLQGTKEKEKSDLLGMGESACNNCQGKDADFAWDTVGLLKIENRGLKERVASLEEGVSSALDAVWGFGLR